MVIARVRTHTHLCRWCALTSTATGITGSSGRGRREFTGALGNTTAASVGAQIDRSVLDTLVNVRRCLEECLLDVLSTECTDAKHVARRRGSQVFVSNSHAREQRSRMRSVTRATYVLALVSTKMSPFSEANLLASSYETSRLPSISLLLPIKMITVDAIRVRVILSLLLALAYAYPYWDWSSCEHQSTSS